MTEQEQKAIEKLEIEGTENNYLEVKIVLDLIDKQQEILRKQSYTNKKLRNKIKTVRKERNKLKADIEIKDKVIDLAIKMIDNYENQLNISNFKNKKEIKEFLFKKVEEEKC